MVDEQQKFSVEQRERMSAHHIVESTATPICRTMALARWGSSIKIFRLTQAPLSVRSTPRCSPLSIAVR